MSREMKNIIITGSTGMVGNLALNNCLNRKDVNKVTIITRRKTGVMHPKLIEVVHENFMDFSSIEKHLKNQDVCIYCLGIYTGQVSNEEFTRITVDYTKKIGEALKANNENLTFCFLSGQGADQKEKSRILFARDKGRAENILLNLGLHRVYIFRPGYIYPMVPRKEPNLFYKIMRVLYKPILSRIYPNIGVTSKRLAEVMVDVGVKGTNTKILENKDILQYELNQYKNSFDRKCSS